MRYISLMQGIVSKTRYVYEDVWALTKSVDAEAIP